MIYNGTTYFDKNTMANYYFSFMHFIYSHCRALKQDLLCTKEFDKKACGEDAANVHDTISRIYLHEFGKVRGCYLPGEFYGITTYFFQR